MKRLPEEATQFNRPARAVGLQRERGAPGAVVGVFLQGHGARRQHGASPDRDDGFDGRIGGLRIQVGSDLYDGSVKTRLEKLQQSF